MVGIYQFKSVRADVSHEWIRGYRILGKYPAENNYSLLL